MDSGGSIDSQRAAGEPHLWRFRCAWCGASETIDTREHPPVNDARNGLSTTRGWEVSYGLVVCPCCCEHDEWSRLS